MKPVPFAARVRERMRQRGLGLRELCRAVSLDPSFFSKVLAGKRSPPADEAALRRIARVLDLDAPGLIVAAGRIPQEWRGLWDDDALLDEVHRVATGGAAAGTPRPSFRRGARAEAHAPRPEPPREAAPRPERPRGAAPPLFEPRAAPVLGEELL